MEKLEKKVKTNVQILEDKFQDNSFFKEHEKANRVFQGLVEKGITSKRGNNLLSVSDSHIKRQVWFNLKKTL